VSGPDQQNGGPGTNGLRVFFSDAHLPSRRGYSVQKSAVEQFLNSLVDRKVAAIYILGDLFDLWFEYRAAILSYHFSVLKAFSQLRDAGTQLHLVVGNHDYWAGRFLRDEVGFHIHKEPLIVEFDERRVYMCHGDGLNKRDFAYRMFRPVLRFRPAIAAFRLVHPDFAVLLGRIVSKFSRRNANLIDAGNETEAKAIRSFAGTMLDRPDIDVFIGGHCHIPCEERFQVNGTNKVYLNTGDWMARFSYIEYENGVFSLRKFEPEQRT
jgi:UDP-2,3-diacylglucosamine hydrolase